MHCGASVSELCGVLVLHRQHNRYCTFAILDVYMHNKENLSFIIHAAAVNIEHPALFFSLRFIKLSCLYSTVSAARRALSRSLLRRSLSSLSWGSKTRNGTEQNERNERNVAKSKVRPHFLFFSITKALSKVLCLILASSAARILP